MQIKKILKTFVSICMIVSLATISSIHAETSNFDGKANVTIEWDDSAMRIYSELLCTDCNQINGTLYSEFGYYVDASTASPTDLPKATESDLNNNKVFKMFSLWKNSKVQDGTLTRYVVNGTFRNADDISLVKKEANIGNFYVRWYYESNEEKVYVGKETVLDLSTTVLRFDGQPYSITVGGNSDLSATIKYNAHDESFGSEIKNGTIYVAIIDSKRTEIEGTKQTIPNDKNGEFYYSLSQEEINKIFGNLSLDEKYSIIVRGNDKTYKSASLTVRKVDGTLKAPTAAFIQPEGDAILILPDADGATFYTANLTRDSEGTDVVFSESQFVSHSSYITYTSTKQEVSCLYLNGTPFYYLPLGTYYINIRSGNDIGISKDAYQIKVVLSGKYEEAKFSEFTVATKNGKSVVTFNFDDIGAPLYNVGLYLRKENGKGFGSSWTEDASRVCTYGKCSVSRDLYSLHGINEIDDLEGYGIKAEIQPVQAYLFHETDENNMVIRYSYYEKWTNQGPVVINILDRYTAGKVTQSNSHILKQSELINFIDKTAPVIRFYSKTLENATKEQEVHVEFSEPIDFSITNVKVYNRNAINETHEVTKVEPAEDKKSAVISFETTMGDVKTTDESVEYIVEIHAYDLAGNGTKTTAVYRTPKEYKATETVKAVTANDKLEVPAVAVSDTVKESLGISSNDKVEVKVEEKALESIPEAAKVAIKNELEAKNTDITQESIAFVDIKIEVNDEKVDLDGNKVTVFVPYPANANAAAESKAKRYTIYHIHDDGTLEVISGDDITYGAYGMTFEVDSFSIFGLQEEKEAMEDTSGKEASTLPPAAKPTSVSGGKLQITGTTTAMEYKLSTDSSWTQCLEGTTTVSKAGTYYVRVAATEANLESDYVTITVTDSTSSGDSESRPSSGGGSSSSSTKVDTSKTYSTLPTSAIKNQLTKGTATTVKLSGAASVGKEIFETLAGRDTTLTLTTMNGKNEVVSFTFDSKGLVEAKEFNTGLTFTSTFDATIKEQVKGDVKVLNFAHSGTLPGKATVTVNVSDTFADGTVLTLSKFNETTNTLDVVAKDIIVANGKVSFELDHCSVWTLSEQVEEAKPLDLSAYSNFGLNVYANSRVTSVKANAKGFDVAGYMWIDGVNATKNTWREIIFVNSEDASTAKAYRKSVNAEYNPWLNKNMVASKNGTVKLDYANYTVNVDPTNMQNYTKTQTGAMASGTYLVYMRISDGKNSYLFPLVDRPLSDGSTMESDGTLPAGFSINDQETRTLVYTVK